MTAVVRHVGGLLAVAVVVLAPFPLCRAVASGQREGPEPAAAGAMAALTTWCTVEIALGVVLGALGHLALGPILVAEAIVLAVGVRHAAQARRLEPSQLGVPDALVAAALSVTGLATLLRLIVTPITDVDSLTYHLPAIARWYQAHALVLLPELPAIRRYPYGWEILSSLLVCSFRDDFLIALPNIVAWTTLGVATFLLAREVGAGRRAAVLAVFLLLTTPTIRDLVVTMHVDLPLAAFFATALYYSLAYRRPRTLSNLALLTAALGLLVATKTSGLVYAAIVVAAGLALGALRAPIRNAQCGLAALLAITGMISGAFWYARNWLEVGNPVGLVAIDIGPIHLFPGTVHPEALHATTLAGLFDPARTSDLKIFLAALRSQVGLPGALLGSGVVLRFMRLRTYTMRHIVLFALFIVTATAYWFTPYGGDNGEYGHITPWIGQAVRYALPCLVIVTTLAALGFSSITDRRAALAVGFLAIIVFLGTIRPTTVVAVSIVLALGVAVVAMRNATCETRRRVVAVSGAALVAATFGLHQNWKRVRAKAYGAIPDYVSNHVRNGERVAYLLTRRPYIFYGARLTTPVVYLPAGDSRARWIAGLRAAHATYVGIGPLGPHTRERPEVTWLRDPDGLFVPVLGTDPNREPVLYRLRDGD